MKPVIYIHGYMTLSQQLYAELRRAHEYQRKLDHWAIHGGKRP